VSVRAGRPAISTRARVSVDRARVALGDRRAAVNVVWLLALCPGSEPRISGVLEELEELIPLGVEIRRRQREAGRRSFAQFRAPFELYTLVRLLEPEHILETGVSSGVSSAYFLAGLRRNGHGTLHSADLPTPQRSARFGRADSPVALPPGRATGWAVPDGLRAGWDLRLGPSRKVLPQIVRGIDALGIFLHDSEHTPSHLAFELATVRPRLADGAVVLADNTIWTGRAFPRFASALGSRVARRGRSDLVGLRVPGPGASG